jgi:serine/threonine-protein kinase
VDAPHAFAIGHRLGPYRIEGLLGVGGMGEVYRARDPKLERDIAIKVLPSHVTADSERLARFEREARLLAALNHPNIAGIYGFEEFDGAQALVLEFVDGPTLADRIARGAIPIDEAFSIVRQICDALEGAHEHGIIHRDLKPANIKLRPDGTVKVLDFGLAKTLDAPSTATDSSQSPTITSPAMTRMGVILGTAAYMSPEQAKGRAADQRSDVWACGCVLYEMLTGRRAFEGDEVSETLAAVLRSEPNWDALPKNGNAPLRRLLRHCLEKDPKRRLAHVGDIRLAIDDARDEVSGPTSPRLTRFQIRRPAVVVTAALFTAILLGALIVIPTDRRVLVQRVTIPLGAGRQIAGGSSPVLALSPDGRMFVYVARAGRTQLFLRRLDQFDAIPLAGSEGASAPFFSPDGNWIGFFDGDALQKLAIDGGAPLKICDVPSVHSASWSQDGTIIFATGFSGDGLWRVSADGGVPEQLTKPDVDKAEIHHGYPQVLSGGKRVLFTVASGDSSYPAMLSIGSRRWQTVSRVRIPSGSVQYVPTGHLLYAQAGGLMAIPFSIDRGIVSGSPVSLRERVEMNVHGVAQFAVAPAGSGWLVYVPRTPPKAALLTLVDRQGHAAVLTDMIAAYSQPRFSPDGRRIAVTVESDLGTDIWVYDLSRGARTRLTSDGASGFATWGPDGRTVTFHTRRSNAWTMFSRLADGSSRTDPVIRMPLPPPPIAGLANIDKLLPGYVPALSGANPQYPMAWANDGHTLAFTERKPSGERDIWTLQPDGNPIPFLVTPFDESSPVLSPDGRFLAYASDETGRNEVYVQPYPGPGGRWLISTTGGEDPSWSANGRELFYRSADALIAVTVQTTSTVMVVGQQRRLFERYFEVLNSERNYDVSPDGEHFVMIRSESASSAPIFHLVLNWFSNLDRPVSPR